VATNDDKHPDMLDEELLPLQMHRQGEWAPDIETSARLGRYPS
jgi:hypothetical protein